MTRNELHGLASARTQMLYPTQMSLLFISCYCHEFWNGESQIRLMDLFSSFKENFKNLLSGLNSLITGWSFVSFFYLSSFSLSQRWKFWRICSNVSLWYLHGITRHRIKHCLYKGIKVSSPNTLSSSMPKNFSLVISKLLSAFSLWLYSLVQPTTLSINASSKNDSESERGPYII